MTLAVAPTVWSRLLSAWTGWTPFSFIRDSRGFKYWKRQRLRKRKHYKI